MGVALQGLQTGLLNQSSAQVIDGSLKFDSAKSQVLTRTPAVERNRKTWTFSFWVKLFQNSSTFIGVFGLSGTTSGSQSGLDIRFNAAFQLSVSNQINNSNVWSLVSTAVHRDTGWYHVVIAHDTTQPVETDRLKMYVNGKQITSFQTSSYPTLNYESTMNKALPHRIGSWDDKGSIYAPMEGMLSNIYMIEGKSLGPGYFGSTDPLTGTWRPRKASADFRILGSGLIYSSYGSGTVSGSRTYDKAFNGSTSTFCEPNDNSTITFDFTSLPGGGITVGSSLRMYLNKAGTPAAGHFTVNGTNLGGSVPSGDWLTIGSVSRLDTITFYHQSTVSSVELYAVEIDGVVLVDGTATKTTVNDGTQWSSGGGSGLYSGSTWGPLFDGTPATDGSDIAQSPYVTNNGTSTVTFPKPISGILRFRACQGSNSTSSGDGRPYVTLSDGQEIRVDGANNSPSSHSFGYVSGITSVTINGTSAQGMNLLFLQVDGVLMIDSTTQKLDFGPNGFYLPMDGNSSIGEDKSGKGNDWTPVNFGGFTTLDKATGALPILNTVSGGNFASSGTRTDAFASPNDGTVWSSALVGDASGFQSTAQAADGFDGEVGSSNNQYAQNNTGSNPSTITFTPPGGIPFTQSIEVYLINADNTVNVNGEGAQTIAANEWVTVKTGSGTLSTIVFSRASTGGASFSAIKVDGHILKDSSYEGLAIALPLIGNVNDVSSNFRKRVVGTLTRLRFKTDWNWMYVSAIEINGTILTTGTLDNSGSVWTDPDKWKNGSVGSGQETYSQSARGDWFDVTLASSIQLETLRIYVYLDSSSGSTTNIFELELFFDDISNLTKVIPTYNGAPNGNFNQRSWQDFKDVRTKILASNGNVTASSTQSNFYGGSYYFDGTTDFLSTGGSTDYVVNGMDWTVEFFLYANSTSGVNILIENTSNGSGGWSVQLNSGNIQCYLSSGSALLSTAVVANKWYHIALVRNSSTTSLYIDGISKATTSVDAGSTASDKLTIGARADGNYALNGYIQDVRFYKGVAKYTSNFVVPATSPDILPETPSGVSGSSKLAKVTDGAVAFDGTGDYLTAGQSEDYNFGTGSWTIECFAYFNNITSSQDITDFTNNASATGSPGGQFYLSSAGGGTLMWYESSTQYAAAAGKITPKRWHHLAVVKNSSGDTIKIYIDGKEEGSSSHTESSGTNAGSLRIGLQGSTYFNGFLSNLRVIKGTALYTANFTPPTRTLTNVTNTKLLCCQSNTSATTAAVIPTGTITANGDAAATNFNPFNTDINTVRGQETGYCTLNPLDKSSQTNIVLTNENLDAANTSSSGQGRVDGTVAFSSGKWYFEGTVTGSSNYHEIGIIKTDQALAYGIGFYSGGYSYIQDGTKFNNNSTPSYGASYTTGDTIGVAFDADNGTLTFYKNGASQGTAFSGLSGEFTFTVGTYSSGANFGWSSNFGQKPFKFPPPAGFQPLNAANVRPETVITRSDHYVGVTTYTGTTANPATINSENNFTPDFVWVKSRSNGESHALYDTVRGATYRLRSDTNGEQTTGGNELQSFILGGFTTGNNGHIYYNGYSYVAWMWKAGGNKNTFNVDDVGYASAAAAGITEGTISLTGASIGTKQGFSILSYSGSGSNGTFGHGLLETPELVIVKCRNVDQNWAVQHSAYGPTKYTYLNSTNEARTTGAAAFWNNTAPTASTVSVGTDNDTNASASGRTYIAYCWHNVPGLQKFGSCKGSGTSVAPDFVELGFKPSIVWVKRTDNTGNWTVWDSTRNTFNPSQKQLFPNTSGTEQDLSVDAIDILSNGFVIRSSSSFTQTGSQTYLYCAWAESPTFNLYGAQSNAR